MAGRTLVPHAGAPSMTSAETTTPATRTTKGHVQVSKSTFLALCSVLKLSIVFTAAK